MREHPIPQDITGYRFHIIGSMTLKQFAEIALGVVVAVILYNTNLLSIIKWPLIGLSVALGAAAAFLPIQERPLDHWIVTFWKVLYKPTLFYWKRKPTIPSAFSFVANASTKVLEPEFDLSPIRRQRIKEYIGSVTHSHAEPYDLNDDEQARVTAIMESFTTQPVVASTISSTPTPTEKPDLEVRVRKLRPQQTLETELYSSVPILAVEQEILPTTTEVPATPTTSLAQEAVAQDTVAQDTVAQEIAPPNIMSIAPTQPIDVIVDVPKVVNQNVAFNTDLPFPSTPTIANKVVGMVLTQENDLISDAIVEIKTSEDVVARAVKSNALGQFFITTPLADGEYTIFVEKDGFTFTPQHLILQNKIVEPIEIRSS